MYSINSLIRVEAGRQGETGLRKVVIDCTAWTEAYDGIGIILVAVRPGETEQYMPSGVTVSGGILTWVPDAYDTANAGQGQVTIQGVSPDGGVIKSAKAPFSVEAALGIECEVGTAGPAATIEVSDALPLSPALLNIVLQPAQSGSGDPSPENIRPISGTTELTLTHTAGGEMHAYPVTWETSAGAVYGGTLNVLTGTLTVNSMMVTLSTIMTDGGYRGLTDLGDCLRLVLTYIAADGSTSSTNTGIDLFGTDNNDAVSDWLKQTPKQYNRNEAGFYLYGTHGFYVKFPKSSFADAEAIEAYLSEHPLHILIGSLTNPTVYHVNPASIKLGLGTNTLMTDNGEITLYYVREVS